ncbi:MAG: choice-of-anchor D domain-containing protein [Myxococcota bacterium]|jgi:hypothetical protein|nr:choice-of-anchor D domain-containing protein [Myxococcota bacterium]
MLRPLQRLLPLVLLLTGCPTEGDDDDAATGTPDIHVTPPSIEFNPLLAGESASFPITIANTGDATLTLEELSLDGEDGFEVEDTVERLVEPDASVQLDVTCAPTGDGALAADLHIFSDDPDTPDVAVALTCTGMAPVIEVDPVDIDFGDVPIGCEVQAEATISSVGSVAFQLSEVAFAPTSDEMSVSWYFQGGAELAPGMSEIVTLYYEPQDEAPDTGYLTLSTDMPSSPTVTVTAVGNGALGAEVTDEFVGTGKQSDILWVINDTASMADEMVMLGNLSGFWDILGVLDVDWQMGVITSSAPWLHGEVPVITTSTPDGLLVFLDALAIPRPAPTRPGWRPPSRR